MKPGKKAQQILDRHYMQGLSDRQAKECAIITVDEILLSNPTWFIDPTRSTHKYWESVLEELNKL